jgi:hypothetical protein
VPYINRYGVEDQNRFEMRYDPYVRGLAIFMPDYGDTPNFLRQHHGRQRQCVIAGLCQVCGRPVPWRRRYLVMSTISTALRYVDDLETRVPVITEPWLDQRCAVFALERCPGLIRRRTAEDLVLVAVTSEDQVRLAVSNGWVDGPLEQASRDALPAMWAEIVVESSVPADHA